MSKEDAVPVNKDNGLVPQYFITVIFTVVLCLAVSAIFVMDKLNATLAAKINDLRTLETRYDYTQLKQNSEALRESAKQFNLAKYDIDTASRSLLAYSDYLNLTYNATMSEGIIAEPNILKVRMKLSYLPKDVDDFVAFIRDLVLRGIPATYISELLLHPSGNSRDQLGVYIADGELIITHPYYQEDGK